MAKQKEAKDLDKMTRKELLNFALEKYDFCLNPKDTKRQLYGTIALIQEDKGAEIHPERFEGTNPFIEKAEEEKPDKENPERKPAKIASIAVIKKASIKPECGDLNYDGFDFTSEQYEQIANWVKGKERLLVTMEEIQGRLPGCE